MTCPTTNTQTACELSANEPVGTTSLNAGLCNLSFEDKRANSTDLTVTNRVGDTYDTAAGAQAKIRQAIIDAGIEYQDPIPNWTANTEISSVTAYRYPANTGDIYAPIAALPFTTGATFNPSNWAIIQGVGDLDGLTVEPIRQAPQFGDGVRTVFSAPGTVIYDESRYIVQFSGREQSPTADDGVSKIWNVSGVGEITFTSPVPRDVRVDIKLYQPLTTTAPAESSEITFSQDDTEASTVTVESKLRESSSIKEYGATGEASHNATQAFIDACTNNAVVDLIDGTYVVDELSLPSTAKVRKIKIKNASLRLKDGQLDINLAGQHIDIDMSAGGVIHGGLQKVKVSADTAVGQFIIPCVDTSEIVVGQTIASSFQWLGAQDGSKWTNSIRVPGDEFNTVTAKTDSSITVNFSVGQAGTGFTNPLWENMWLGNADFTKSGLRFLGYGKVTITGGQIKEARSGYYLSTDGTNTGGGLIVETNDVDFSGQFLDGFRIFGHSSFIANNGSMIGSYDLAKQLFVPKHVGNHIIQLNNVKVARGNNDLDFFPFGNDAGDDVSLCELNNCEMDGTWTLDVGVDQVNSITGQALNAVFPAQNALHCYTFEGLRRILPATSAVTKGFIARNTVFKNYRRAVCGTTFTVTDENFDVENLMLIDCVFDRTAPYYMRANTGFEINIENRLISNAVVSRSTDDGNIYPLGISINASNMHYSGTTYYDPAGAVAIGRSGDFQVQDDVSFDHLYIKGDGDIRVIGDNFKVSKVTVDEGRLYDLNTSYDPHVPPLVDLVNGGERLSANTYEVDTVASSSRLVQIPANNTDWHIIRRDVQRPDTTTPFGNYFTIYFSGYRLFASTYGIEGIAAGIASTTATPIVRQSSDGYETITSTDKMVWISSGVISHGFGLTDSSIEIMINSDGHLAMRVTIAQPQVISLVVDVKGGRRFD